MLLLAVVVYVVQTWTILPCLAADLARTAAGAGLFIMLAGSLELAARWTLRNHDSFDSFKRFLKTILFGRY